MLKSKIIGTGTAVLLAGALGMVPGAASANAAPVSTAKAVAAAQPAPIAAPTVLGTYQGTAFTGTLSNLTTSVVGDVVMLTGQINHEILPGGSTTFSAPIEDLQATQGCKILTLDLGPLNLDLLGLVVDLSAISLDITAVPGPGNLLGNLLCAVAGLLDGPGNALGGVTALLNRILSGLGLAA